jgi:hypothetical protein
MGEVQNLIRAFVKAVNEGDEFSAHITFTKIRNLGITEDDLLTKGYVSVEEPNKLDTKSVQKKKSASKSRRASRRSK